MPLSDMKILLISSNVYMWVAFKLFIVRKTCKFEISDSHRSWRFTNVLRRLETRVKLFFVNSKLLLPKKSSKLEMYLILPNFLNLMYVRRVTWCACFPLICIVCAFVVLHEFTTVRCYGRDGAKKRGTMNCVRFRSTCPNNRRIIHCLWNT